MVEDIKKVNVDKMLGEVGYVPEEKEEAIKKVREDICKQKLDDVTINNGKFGKEVWENFNAGYLEGKCTWEFWEAYWKERNKEEEPEEKEKAYAVFGIKGQAEHFYSMQPFFYDNVKTFHLWNEEMGKWESCDDIDMLNKLQENIPHADTINSKQKTEILTALQQVGRLRKPKDIPKTWIQFKDKIVDVLSGEEFEASPEYYTTNPLPWKLGDSEETPIIDQLLREWVVDGDYQNETYIKTMKQIIAYIICSDQFLQRLIALCGAGLNGKGTFIKMILKFLGVENSCSSDLKILATNNFEAASLYRKLLCVMGEVDTSDMKNTNTIKKLSGEDGMRYEFKGKGSFTDESPTTCLIATNSLPTTPDKSLGFYRRWLIIDFPHQFSIKRDLIGQIPDIEFENLGRCCLNLLKEMYSENKFENEGELSQRMDKYEERSNPIMRFIEKECEEDYSKKVEVREFCSAFNEYLKTRHLRVKSPKEIKKMMKEEGFDDSPRSITVDGELISRRFFINISLKTTKTTETTENGGCFSRGDMTLENCSNGSFCSSEDKKKGIRQISNDFQKVLENENPYTFPKTPLICLKDAKPNNSDDNKSKFTDEELKKLGYSEEEIKDLLGDYKK